MAVPPTILRGRMRTVTYLYDDPDHPDRPTGHVSAPEWTEVDRALLLGLGKYEDTLCPGGCGQPRELAWHDWMAGEEFEATKWVCHACTARTGHEVVFSTVAPVMSPERMAMRPPFVLGETTTEPTEKPDEH